MNFPVSAGYEVLAPVGSDGSNRKYARVRYGAKTAILMESVPDGSPGATAGHSVSDYVRISQWLRDADLNAPEVYEADPEKGFMLVEDFGDLTFRRAMECNAESSESLYALAADVLKALSGHEPIMNLVRYYDSHVHKGRRRIIDWFIPAQNRVMNRDGLAEEYLAVWDAIEKDLPPVPTGFVHIDYHFENLMWLPQESGLRRCGILDFQGAMIGPLPYDLVNLLEDVRVDVPEEVQNRVMNRYCAGMNRGQAESFRLWYRILGTQFHCRIAGQFIKMALRDGKTSYLAHLPRVLNLLDKGLKAPVLAPLRHWFAENGIDLTRPPDVNPEEARRYIREDAF